MNGGQDGLVLELRGDDRVPGRVAPGAPRPEHGEVVALGAARGETDLIGVRAETSGNALASLIERSARLTPPPVGARGIPEARAEVRLHRFEDLGTNRGRSRVVEVDRGRHGLNIALTVEVPQHR